PETFIIGRTISALMGVIAVGIVGIAGRQMYGARVGFVAAALMAVVPFHVLYSHLAATDLTLCACATATLACAYAAARGEGSLPVFAAGVAAGLAFSSKYSGLAMLVPTGWAVLERTARSGPGRGLRLAVVALLGFAVAVMVACPWCALNPRFMLAGMQT